MYLTNHVACVVGYACTQQFVMAALSYQDLFEWIEQTFLPQPSRSDEGNHREIR